MSIRWQFVEGYEGDSSFWSWRVVNMDGSIESQSPPFSTYGLAVGDAIKNGFQPRQQHWLVGTRHTITHFRPGKPPLTVPVSVRARRPEGRAGARRSRPAAGNARGYGAGTGRAAPQACNTVTVVVT
jgi:hypothetical protein